MKVQKSDNDHRNLGINGNYNKSNDSPLLGKWGEISQKEAPKQKTTKSEQMFAEKKQQRQKNKLTSRPQTDPVLTERYKKLVTRHPSDNASSSQ
jgi:hypothetical protein